MADSTPNPYAAPTASVEPARVDRDDFAPFPRFSAWWVFLLSIVTFTFYGYYWLFTRSQVVNKHYPQFTISNGLIWSALTVMFAQLLLVILVFVWVSAGIDSGDFDPTSSMVTVVDTIDTILSWAGIILWYVWVYALRSRINMISGAQRGDRRRVGPILTFFFTIIYLAYKINQIKDSE